MHSQDCARASQVLASMLLQPSSLEKPNQLKIASVGPVFTTSSCNVVQSRCNIDIISRETMGICDCTTNYSFPSHEQDTTHAAGILQGTWPMVVVLCSTATENGSLMFSFSRGKVNYILIPQVLKRSSYFYQGRSILLQDKDSIYLYGCDDISPKSGTCKQHQAIGTRS